MLVDDHLVVRKGLASLLEDEDDLTVVAEAGCGEEAIAQFAATKPDIAVLDLRLPDMSGIDVALALKEADPDAKLMILSSFRQEEDVHRAFEAGVLGYLSKDASSPEILEAIREVTEGRRWVPARVSQLLAKHASENHLSKRETEILALIANGMANKEIGAHLGLAENTIKNHVKSILSKLGARDRTHAVTEGLKRGILQLTEPKRL
ncbi:response regulator transcription factor [Verrucomicrobiales bacterium]|nr:response regulator transcription factor [Verrucomicrobiales bacterium]